MLKYFNPAAKVEVQVDASLNGLGAYLMQGGQPIQNSSGALTETKNRFSQIEKRCFVLYVASRDFIPTCTVEK